MAGSKADDDASKMAEKLLQGWTMLAEYCPMEGCLAPLMRSREGRRYCVSHEMFVMSPEEAEAMRATLAKQAGGGAEPAGGKKQKKRAGKMATAKVAPA